MTLNRRDLLRAAGAAALLGGADLGRLRAQEKGPTRRLLFYTKSSGFEHSVIKRVGDQPSHADKVLTELGKEHGFEVVCSKDGRLFDPDKIGQWDLFAFETTGDLTRMGDHKDGHPMSEDGKKAFLDAIRAGKGFVGMHCATDTFHSRGDTLDPYIEMIGGEFIVHGEQQEVTIDVADEKFPGAGPLGSSFVIKDEWYALKNFPDDLHVVLVQDTKDMKKTGGGNTAYDRPNFPETWARMHGKGRVFYTSMGHREEVWSDPRFQGLLVGALAWASGRQDADVTPNVEKVTPGYKQYSK